MSLTIMTTSSTSLPLRVVEQIRDELTNRGSQTYDEMHQISRGLTGQFPADMMPDFPIAVCLWTSPYTDDLEAIGWVSATNWDNIHCLQGYVAPDYRRMGLATALASALLVDSLLCRDNPIGVFSDEFVQIARRLRFSTIYRYRRTQDGWLKSPRLLDHEQGQEQPRRIDEAGLRNAAPALRDMPLADGSAGSVV